MADEKKGYYTSRAGVTPARINPWAGELVHTIKKGRRITAFASTKHALVNQTTGEVSEDVAVMGVQKVVDQENFIKVFGAGMAGVFELAKPAQDVFLAIMRIYLQQSGRTDQLYFNHPMLVEYWGYTKSRASFNNGVNELCVKGFIAPVEAMDSLYWVNPNLIYKGDRMRIVTEYVRAGSRAAKQLEKEQALAKQGVLGLDHHDDEFITE